MPSRKGDVWTRQCSDGRACGGIYDSPRFIPDDIDVCDDCLAAQYGLDEVSDGCCCGHYSDVVGYSTASVMKALREGVKPKRYYAGIRVELDERGRLADASKDSFIGVYDSEQPRPRKPLEEKAWREKDAQKWAYDRAAELNLAE